MSKIYFHEVDREEAFGGLIKQVDLQSSNPHAGLEEYTSELCDYLKGVIDELIVEKGPINFWLSVTVNYSHPSNEAKKGRPVFLHTGKLVITNREEVEEKLQKAMMVILKRNSDSIREKSGLVINSIENTRFKVVDYLPL